MTLGSETKAPLLPPWPPPPSPLRPRASASGERNGARGAGPAGPALPLSRLPPASRAGRCAVGGISGEPISPACCCCCCCCCGGGARGLPPPRVSPPRSPAMTLPSSRGARVEARRRREGGARALPQLGGLFGSALRRLVGEGATEPAEPTRGGVFGANARLPAQRRSRARRCRAHYGVRRREGRGCWCVVRSV
eukprot:103042-Chlamydomonas_euryale.AAC.3